MSRPANDENAPATRIGAVRHTRSISSDVTKNNVVASNETVKPALSTTATARARPALAQQRANTNTSTLLAGKRKRDALGDANGKGKTVTSSLLTKAASAGAGAGKPSSTATSSTTANTTRASSVSTTQTKENAARPAKENVTRARAALGVKPKNVVNAAPVAKDEKETLKQAKAEQVVTGKTVTRKPLASKSAQTTTLTSTANVEIKARKETHTIEKKASEVSLHAKVEKAEIKMEIKEEIDEEDAARAHKRPRLSEIEEVGVTELGNLTVDKVQKVLETTFVKPEDEVPDDLDKDDLDDPLMVAEYAVEIFDYLYALEVRFLISIFRNTLRLS